MGGVVVRQCMQNLLKGTKGSQNKKCKCIKFVGNIRATIR